MSLHRNLGHDSGGVVVLPAISSHHASTIISGLSGHTHGLSAHGAPADALGYGTSKKKHPPGEKAPFRALSPESVIFLRKSSSLRAAGY